MFYLQTLLATATSRKTAKKKKKKAGKQAEADSAESRTDGVAAAES